MSNMSYCRFRNTDNDLSDCKEALDDLLYRNEEAEPLSRDELEAADSLISNCLNIVNTLVELLGTDDLDHVQRKYKELLTAMNTDAKKRRDEENEDEE